MEEKEAVILQLLQEKEYVPMKAKELALLLQVPKSEYEEFRQILNQLEQQGKIQKNRKEKYTINERACFVGIFEAKEKGYGFVKIETEEVYVPIENRNGAWDGDTVQIEIVTPKIDGFKAEGKITKVIKRSKNTLVGIFKNSRNFGFVIPDDKKWGTDIYISKKNFGKARNDHKVVVEITKYPEKGKKAEGKIIEVIGNVNAAGVDMMSLIKEYHLPYVFPEQVAEQAKQANRKIDKKDIPNRKDFRDKAIYTIDGEDAKDLDDAISIEKTEQGTYLLGVHIADVSYYVKENSFLDKEAFLRGTSVYMMSRVIPMLPRELSNGICSLNAGEDRYTMSVVMEINQQGKVISSDITKGIIQVKERMNYSDVTKLLEKADDKLQEKYQQDMPCFELMKELALILKKKRDRQGSLDLDIPESKVILDQNGVAVNIQKYELTIANEIIEQFMVIANETVAEKFYWLEAPFIYRVHEVPEKEKIEELNKVLYHFGYRIKGNKDNIYPMAFAEILKQVKGKPEEKIISNLILRTLKVARYENENKGHFGLASKYYCHFTSPIRRYPDLFIHRIISYYLEKGYKVKEEYISTYTQLAIKSAQQASEREKIAQKVEREAIDMKKAEYMQGKIGTEYSGIISNITSFGIFVELENTVEGFISFENLGEEYFIYDEQQKSLLGEHSKTIYKIGDRIDIVVIGANKELRRVDFAKVEK